MGRRQSLRLGLAHLAGRVAGAASRIGRRGGGTAISGIVAARVDPDVRRHAFADRGLPVIAVSGSNGKTTTAGLAAAALRAAGRGVAANAAGSNMIQGISALAIETVDGLGRPRADVAVAEVDEAALLAIVDELRPRVLVVTNVVRDQLDRFGELYATAAALEQAAERQPADGTLVLCADDALVASLAPHHRDRRFVGLDLAESHDRITSAADSIRCPACRTPLVYRAVHLGHLGDWSCPGCGRTRPALDVAVTAVEPVHGGTSVTFRLADGSTTTARIPQRGLHVAYDAGLALAAVTALGVDADAAATAFGGVRPSWGRLDSFDALGRHVILAFAKNPMSYRTVIGVLERRSPGLDLLLVHSSSPVDGEDFGWLWDVEYERLRTVTARASVAGDKAGELANRLAYANWPMAGVTVRAGEVEAFDAALEATPTGGTLAVVSGYSPLRRIVEHAQRRGWTHHYWET
ncbi:MAG TPA: MurT ligase domain-containing protein [Candidatus Limnocylindrales bacterium]